MSRVVLYVFLQQFNILVIAYDTRNFIGRGLSHFLWGKRGARHVLSKWCSRGGKNITIHSENVVVEVGRGGGAGRGEDIAFHWRVKRGKREHSEKWDFWKEKRKTDVGLALQRRKKASSLVAHGFVLGTRCLFLNSNRLGGTLRAEMNTTPVRKNAIHSDRN